MHEGGIDMVVHFLDNSDHFEVVVTYAAKDEPYDPGRMHVAMVEGDGVHFGLPGQRHVMYGFTRISDTVHVTADPVKRTVEQAFLD